MKGERKFYLYKKVRKEEYDVSNDKIQVRFEKVLIGKLSERVIKNWFSIGLINNEDLLKEALDRDFLPLTVIDGLERVNSQGGRVALQDQVRVLDYLECPLDYDHLTFTQTNDLIKLWAKIKKKELDEKVVRAHALYELELFRTRKITIEEDHLKWLKRKNIKMKMSAVEIERRMAGDMTLKQHESLDLLGFEKTDLSKNEAQHLLNFYKTEYESLYSAVIKEEVDFFEELNTLEHDKDLSIKTVWGLFLNTVIPGIGTLLCKEAPGDSSYIKKVWAVLLLTLVASYGFLYLIPVEALAVVMAGVVMFIGVCVYLVYYCYMQADLVTRNAGYALTGKGALSCFLSSLIPGLKQLLKNYIKVEHLFL